MEIRKPKCNSNCRGYSFEATVKKADGTLIANAPLEFASSASISVKSTTWTGWYKGDSWATASYCPNRFVHGDSTIPDCTAPMTMTITENGDNIIVTGRMWDGIINSTATRIDENTIAINFGVTPLTVVTTFGEIGSKMNGNIAAHINDSGQPDTDSITFELTRTK
jgi:hypothetical protein